MPKTPILQHSRIHKTANFVNFQFILIFSLTLIGCNQTPVVEIKSSKDKELKERLINANKYIASSEQTQINGYISRRGWQCEPLPCGAYLYKLKEGNGIKITYDEQVRVHYSLKTLTDKLLYDNRTDTLVVGRHQATAALDEALLQLRHGSEAYLICPSESGYGVAGDGDRIPSRMVLIYSLRVD